MTCPLNRCDGSGWIPGTRWTDTPASGDQLVATHEPCLCHGWRPIGEAGRNERHGVTLVWAQGLGIVAGYFACVGCWYGADANRLDPQPTHYHPRPVPPEFGETT